MAIKTIFQLDKPVAQPATRKAVKIEKSHLQPQKRSLVYRGCHYTPNSWGTEHHLEQVEGQFRGERSMISLPIAMSPRPELSQLMYRGIPAGG